MNNATAARTAACGDRASETLALTRACTALWVATLSLMTAFMQTPAPAHRYLIARKIAKNLHLLREQEEVFTAECRMIFANLAQRWTAKADQLAPGDRPRNGMGLLQRLALKARYAAAVRRHLQAALNLSDAATPVAFAHSWSGVRRMTPRLPLRQRRAGLPPAPPAPRNRADAALQS